MKTSQRTETHSAAIYLVTELSAQARDGAKRSDLERIVRQIMAGWDGLIATSRA